MKMYRTHAGIEKGKQNFVRMLGNSLHDNKPVTHNKKTAKRNLECQRNENTSRKALKSPIEKYSQTIRQPEKKDQKKYRINSSNVEGSKSDTPDRTTSPPKTKETQTTSEKKESATQTTKLKTLTICNLRQNS